MVIVKAILVITALTSGPLLDTPNMTDVKITFDNLQQCESSKSQAMAKVNDLLTLVGYKDFTIVGNCEPIYGEGHDV